MSCTQTACLVSLILFSPASSVAQNVRPLTEFSSSQVEYVKTTGRIDLVQQRWTVPVAGRSPISKWSCPVDGWPSLSLAGEIVLVQDAQGIRALNLQTGRSAWPAGEHDSGFLLQTDPRFEFPDREGSSSCLDGVVHGKFWTGTFAGRLVTLNLLAEGRLEWSRTPEDFQVESDRKVDFAGGPIEIPGGLAISLRESQLEEKRPRGWLVGIDLHGHTRWRAIVPPLPLANRHDACDAITAFGNHIYWNRSGQQFLSLEADTGVIAWQAELKNLQYERGTTHECNAIFAESKILIGTSGQIVRAFNPADGSLLWQQHLDSPVDSISGVHQGIVVIPGEHLTGLEASTGRILWQAGGTNDAGRGLGKGLILADHVLWPTRQELWTISLQSGQVLQRDALPQITKAGGGNLLLRDQTLLIAAPQQLTAFQVLLKTKKPR